MKVLINKCHGGYGISADALSMYADKKGLKYSVKNEYMPFLDLADGTSLSSYNIERNDPTLIAVFEELGSEDFSGICANVAIVEVPDGAEYFVDEYDGLEDVSQIWITASLDELASGLSQEKLDLIKAGCAVKLKGSI
jgi:hypothetical protein